jgi:hypothetical protein
LRSVAVLAQVPELGIFLFLFVASRLNVRFRMALDSPAVFSEKIIELELTEHQERFTRAKWRTLGNLAFAMPQKGTEEEFRKHVLEKGLGDADHDDAHKLRRLFFEAFMLASIHLKQTVGGLESDGPRRMTAPERRERFVRVEKRLSPAVLLRGELEVSKALIDRCVAIWDENSLKYVPLELCTKREMEIQGIEKDPLWQSVPDPVSGLMKFRKLEDDKRSPIDSQFAYMFAMQRRALAFEMADLIAYEKHELLRNRLVQALMEEPFDGFQGLTMDQIVRADVVFFTLLNDQARDGLRRHGALERPLDLIFEATLLHPKFTAALTHRLAPPPQSGAAAIARAFGNPNVVTETAPAGAGKGKKRPNNGGGPKAQPKPKPLQVQKGGKGKGAKKAERGGPRLPLGLIGMCARSSPETLEKRLCFSFNLGTCKQVSPGQECAKGWHLCMKPKANGDACSQAHPATTCVFKMILCGHRVARRGRTGAF